MPTLSEIIREISSSETKSIVKYVCERTNKISPSECTSILDFLKSVNPSDNLSDITIVDMIVVEDFNSSTFETSSANEVLGYTKDNEDNLEFYDISGASWPDVAGMEICNSSLLNLLPTEIIGDIVLLLASVSKISPSEKDSKVTLLTEDNYMMPRKLLYNLLNIPDDRTNEEKDYDSYVEKYTYNQMRKTFGKYILSSSHNTHTT